MKPISIRLYTIPQDECAFGKMTWKSVARLFIETFSKEIEAGTVTFDHIEFFSDVWFSDVFAQELLESHQLSLPFVLVNNELVSTGAKINISKIARHVRGLLSEKEPVL